jgi:uncharacterized repeat protein (TIGR01451 family)
MSRSRASQGRSALRLAVLLVASVCLCLLSVTPAEAADISVTSPDDSGPGTLRAAIATAVDGDTVVIAPGVDPVLTGGQIVIAGKQITIRGQGSEATTIDGSSTGRIFAIGPDAVVQVLDLELTRGRAPNAATANSPGGRGGAIENLGDLTLRGVLISASRAGNSIGVSTGGDGGAIYSEGTLAIEDSELTGNAAGNSPGSGVDTAGRRGGEGGAIYVASGSTATVTGSTLHDNHGGVRYGTTLTADPSGGGRGGAISNYGDLTITDSDLTANSAGVESIRGSNGSGGAISNDGDATITSSLLASNTAGDGGEHGGGSPGGAVRNSGTMLIEDSELSGNEAGEPPTYQEGLAATGAGGGAIVNLAGAQLTVSRSSLTDNRAGNGNYALGQPQFRGGHGGAIENQSGATLEVIESSFADNRAGNVDSIHQAENGAAGGQGGAISNAGTATVESSFFARNSSGTGGRSRFDRGGDGGRGGAIANTGPLTITNVTFHNNTTGNGELGGTTDGRGGHGGALHTTVAVPIRFSTFANNTTGETFSPTGTPSGENPGQGAAIFAEAGGSATVRASIITANNEAIVCSSGVSSAGRNVIQTSGGCPTVASDARTNAAGLGPLGNHGGEVLTFPLVSSSPAIDRLNRDANDCNGTDARGVSRPQRAACDSGAYELAETTEPEADLRITKRDATDPVGIGDEITYILEVTNNGPDGATGVETTDTLPSGVTFMSADGGDATCANALGTVTCDFGELAIGATESTTIVVDADEAGLVENSAEVSGDQPDSNLINNADTEETTVNPRTGTGQFAYVANALADTVTVVDTGTNVAVGEPIAVGDGPNSVAITPDGSRAYVTNANGLADSVSVVDTATNTVTATVDVGIGPAQVAINPNGTRAYVTDNAEDAVYVIDTATNTVAGAPIPAGDGASGIAFTPDGSRAYVANLFGDTVSVIDATSRTVIATVPVGARPAGMAIAPDGSRAYAPNSNDNTVSVIDTATNTVVATMATGNFPTDVAIAPDGSRAYIANRNSDTVSVIELATNTVSATVPVGNAPTAVTTNSDGSRVYVANTDDDTVSVVHTATSTVAPPPITVGDGPVDIALTPGTGGPDPSPEFSVSPTSKDYGEQAVNTSSPAETFTVSNSGTADLHLDTVVMTGTDPSQYAIGTNTCAGQTLAPEATCAVEVSFAPTTVGASAATLRFTHDAGGATDVALSGTGTTAPPATPSLTTDASDGGPLGTAVTNTATLADGADPTGTITFNLYGPEDIDCSGVAVFTDTVTVDGNGAYTSGEFTPTAAGSYRWTAVYSGDDSNEGAASLCNAPNESVTITTDPPETTITGGPGVLSLLSRNATFTFSSSEPGSTYECRLDTAAFVPCTSPKRYTDIRRGNHTFEVRAINAGEPDPTPAQISWFTLGLVSLG